MNSEATKNKPAGTISCRIRRVSGGCVEECADLLAVEEPLEIQLGYEQRGVRVYKSISVTMRTPGNDPELAVGFVLGEQIIDQCSQIEEVSLGEENVVRVNLVAGVAVNLKRLERNFYTSSSCGVCGRASLAAIDFHGRVLSSDGPVFDPAVIDRLPATLRAAQVRFDSTGGLHAAALFDATGKLISRHEDVGRHNAVDKVIGASLLDGTQASLTQRMLFVSGRASFELMQKALLAGIPIMAAIGAPSSLAVELAQYHGATLLGFVREGRFNIYCGAARIGGQIETSQMR
ncbi:formate dehydrogenase accessory sulfurtransferase FdhD [soil metagenome]